MSTAKPKAKPAKAKPETKTKGEVVALKPNNIGTALRAGYVKRIKAAMGKTVGAVLEIGNELLAAKEGPNALPHGDFIPMVEDDLKMDRHTANKFMEIARNPHLSNGANWHHLPPTWTTLYDLSKVPPHRLEILLEKGKITPHITGKEVKELQEAKRPRSKKEKYDAGDEPEEETTAVSNPGFYTGLGGSDNAPAKDGTIACPHCSGTGRIKLK